MFISGCNPCGIFIITSYYLVRNVLWKYTKCVSEHYTYTLTLRSKDKDWQLIFDNSLRIESALAVL